MSYIRGLKVLKGVHVMNNCIIINTCELILMFASIWLLYFVMLVRSIRRHGSQAAGSVQNVPSPKVLLCQIAIVVQVCSSVQY